MSQIQSRRQQKAKESLEQLSENELAIIDEKPIASDGDRSDHKSPKRQQIEKSKSYSFLKWMASVMDKYLLDPLIGLIQGGRRFVEFNLFFAIYLCECSQGALFTSYIGRNL